MGRTMKTGLLWQDEITTTCTLEQCIARAVARYRRKFGTMPTTCAVNAGQRGNLEQVGNVRVVGMITVLKDHFWVGGKDEYNTTKV